MGTTRRTWTDEQLRTAVAESTSWRGTLRSLGLDPGGGAFTTIKARAIALCLDTSHFTGHLRGKGMGNGRDAQAQRAAKQRWYEANKDVYRAGNARRRRRRAELLRELKNAPCQDCGRQYPWYVMEFDHRDGTVKEFSIARATQGIPLARVLDEIEKCDLVCANCHRIRTAERAGWDDDRFDPGRRIEG